MCFNATLVVGILFFPITYIFNDVVTEVYGYRASRKIIWSAMASIVFMSLMYAVTASIPPASFWQNQEAYETILGIVPRVALASIVAFFCGEFVNSYVLSRMKIWSNGKNLWKRTIGSTVAGEGVDTLLFFGITFYGLIPAATLVTLMWSSYLFKVLFEVIATPLPRLKDWLIKWQNIICK